MPDEPRRSGRATKGQHKKASASPAPTPQPKLAKTAKSKPPKKASEPDPDEDDEERIRCVCGNDNPKDKRAFIGCDACTVWQHNVCMGIPDDEDDVPDHYFCEECQPGEHQETLQALAQGEKIWETRNKIYQSEKKATRNRKSKGGQAPPGWLKKDSAPAEEVDATPAQVDGTSVPTDGSPLQTEGAPPPAEDTQTQIKDPSAETEDASAKAEDSSAETEAQTKGSKRKREEVSDEPAPEIKSDAEPERETRQEKRRKPATTKVMPEPDPVTELVDIDKLPKDRQKIAAHLAKIITDVVKERSKTGFRVPDGHTAKSLGEHFGVRIEYELQMVHGGTTNAAYTSQFRALGANLKKNKMLVDRLLNDSLTAHELATMESKDMASEEQQRELAALKEQLDRQAVAIQEEGPRYRRTHKGEELIEDENQHLFSEPATASQPIRERMSIAEESGAGDSNSPKGVQAASPTPAERPPLQIETSRPPKPGHADRRQSSQNFDMNNIWAKTAGSPTQTSAGPRPLQMPPRRRSSIQALRDPQDGTKDDADVDRMLQDDDETYSPADYTGDDSIVWRGKLVQSSDNVEPTVNARFVAGRDIGPTVSWRHLLPSRLTIDGRLQIAKAEDYLQSLQWSNSSDVSVLALTPYDDAEAFRTVFQYFQSRQRYAVVNKDKPPMVKDLYIIPVEIGARLPEHVDMLEHCTIKQPVEEKMLLATFVVARSPGSPTAIPHLDGTSGSRSASTNGHSLPQHMRTSSLTAGPAGSPLNTQNSTFTPPGSQSGPGMSFPPGSLPPNPYGPGPPPPTPAQQQQQQQQDHLSSGPALSKNPLVNEILGPLQFSPTAVQVVSADPNIIREKLEHMRRIMDEFPATRTDIEMFAQKLIGG